jgi:hypothetical protein
MSEYERLCQHVERAGWHINLTISDAGNLTLQVRNPQMKQKDGRPKLVSQVSFQPGRPDAAAAKLLEALLIDT